MTRRAIDYFCNVFTPAAMKETYVDNPELYAVIEWWGLEDRLAGHAPDAFLEVLDRAGVDKVLIPAAALGSYDRRHEVSAVGLEHVIALTEAHPDRYFGVAPINPFERMAGVRTLERLVKDHNFKAAFYHPYGFGMPVNHRDLYPFYAKCAELGVPVIAQVGHSGERMPSAAGQPIHIDDVALYFPELKFVGSHTGWPWTEELIAMAWKHQNVYIGTCAHLPKYWKPEMVAFLNSRGKGKVMWGTDYPFLLHADAVEQVDRWELKPAAKDALMFETAERVFGL